MLGVVDDAARGALVEVVACAGGLAEEGGEFFGLGFELGAVLTEVGSGVVGEFDDLVGELDGFSQNFFHNSSHDAEEQVKGV